VGSNPTGGSQLASTLEFPVRLGLHYNEEYPVHGPVWNNPNVGVTGEPKFRTDPPNYVTTTDAEGKIVTLTGEAATAYRETHGV
jgi:hypothetical protein